MTDDPREDIARLKLTLATLIVWMAQAANTPIRRDEAQRLLEMLSGVDAEQKVEHR